jgi:site-specific DNA-cytosine methylase
LAHRYLCRDPCTPITITPGEEPLSVAWYASRAPLRTITYMRSTVFPAAKKTRRTITPHEVARSQFIPDFFRFETDKRTALATMIGNAVPPKLAYLLALELLR